MPKRAPSSTSWDEYWRADRLASCVPENTQTAGAIASFWIAKFETLPVGSRILDIASGNGIVLAYAARASRGRQRGFALAGVDLAHIDPLRNLSNPDPLFRDTDFRGGVAAESLPFGDASFDCVTSQFGLEYADLDRALDEAARVLRTRGRFFWLAHHVEGEVVRQNAGQRMEVDWLLGADGPYAAMREFVDALRRPSRLPAARDRLNLALQAAEGYCRTHDSSKVIRQVCTEFLAVAVRPQSYRIKDLVQMLDDGERRLRGHRGRMDDLQNAALTPERVALAYEKLRSSAWLDLQIDAVLTGAQGGALGLWLEATRS
jgi:SAM-dependent methyltransferase